MNNDYDNFDYVYYNIRVRKESYELTADYRQEKIVNILNNPIDYEMAVVRYKIPSDGVPLFFFESNYYSLTIERGASDYFKFLNFIPNQTPGTELYGKNGIWTPQEFINSVNVALKSAYLDSGLLNYPPFMTFDPVTKLCSIYKEQTEENDYKIFFNKPLFDKFVGIPSFYNVNSTNKTSELLIVNNYDTNLINYDGRQYIKTSQDYESVNKWSMVQQIILKTTLIPVNPELEGDSDVNITTGKITDFEPDEVYGRQSYYYNSGNSSRYIDLLSHQPLKGIDLSVYFKDNKGNEYKFILGTDTPLSIKLLFRKKLKYQLE